MTNEKRCVQYGQTDSNVINKITDYISGLEVNNTPEEIYAVQPLLRKLVEEYEYPINIIQSHPQYRVSKNPSDEDGSYPIDIAIFSSEEHNDETLVGIIECKSPNLTKGVKQLQRYMSLHPAVKWGVWYNGTHAPKIYIKEITDGKIQFRELPDIPVYGRALSEIESLKKKDLKAVKSLKDTFSSINNYLYGNLSHTDTDTRSRASQMINLLFIKMFDEIYKTDDEQLEFSKWENETKEQLHSRITKFYIENVKPRFPRILSDKDNITFDPEAIEYVVTQLQHIAIQKCSRDAIGDAFEVFVSRALKGDEGQFFTPRNVIDFMIEYVSPKANSKILDPACGSGGFLISALKFTENRIRKEAIEKSWDESFINDEMKRYASDYLFGMDKDSFLVKVCKIYMIIMGDGKAHIYCENSLDTPNNFKVESDTIHYDSMDYIFTNPPFGKDIQVKGSILSNYEFGKEWSLENTTWKKGKKTVSQQPPQVLFVEQCIKLLKDEGILAIVLPEGIFGNPSDRYIWQWLSQHGEILSVVSLPPVTFQPHTHNKCSILFFKKTSKKNRHYITMSSIKNVGHDKDGKELYTYTPDGQKILNLNGDFIINDELPLLANDMKKSQPIGEITESRFSFDIETKKIDNLIFIPHYYESIENIVDNPNVEPMSIGELMKQGILLSTKNGFLPRGSEIGTKAYSLGSEIPFVRTSDIMNGEISWDTTQKTSIEIFEKYNKNQNIASGDILIIKDGTYLIGRTAFVSKLDTKIIIQSHISQIKVLPNNKNITPYLLMYLLNLDCVQTQIRSKTFVQGTISTIGDRLNDIILPIPKDIFKRKNITEHYRKIIHHKTKARIEILRLPKNID